MVGRLDAELARQLRRVEAPEELWDRIERGGTAPAASSARWPVWAFAAAVAAVLALFCFRLRSATEPYLAQLAVQAAGARSATIEFPSDNPAAIRSWIKARTGLDVPLPDGASVRLTGAGVVGSQSVVACVSYRVDGREAKLFVARGNAGAPRHPAVKDERYHDVATTSWSMQGQSYVLVSPESRDLRDGCVLCHVEGAGRRVSPRA